MDAVFGILHFLACLDHFIARAQCLGLGSPGLAHDIIEDMIQLLDVLRQTDLAGVLIDLFVIVTSADSHRTKPVDEGHHHALDADLRLRQAVLQQALLVDDFLQACGRVFQCQVGDRAIQHLLHRLDLSAQPAIVFQQFADVFQ